MSNDQIDLYEVLEIADKSASQSAIKRAYYRLALIHHPDKQGTDADPEQFHKISLAYQILSDPEQRAIYDETGCIPDEKGTNSWSAYFKDHPVTVEKIEQVRNEYQGSAEEAQDLIALYKEFKGSVPAILERLMFSAPDQVPRYRELIELELAKDEPPERYEKFFTWKESKAAKKRRENEASTAADQQSKQPDTITDLVSLINDRKRARASIVDALEAKYCPKEANKPSRRRK